MKYLEPKDLAVKLREGKEKILIVDVRDSDYEVKNRGFSIVILSTLLDGKD